MLRITKIALLRLTVFSEGTQESVRPILFRFREAGDFRAGAVADMHHLSAADSRAKCHSDVHTYIPSTQTHAQTDTHFSLMTFEKEHEIRLASARPMSIFVSLFVRSANPIYIYIYMFPIYTSSSLKTRTNKRAHRTLAARVFNEGEKNSPVYVPRSHYS